jgi:tetratricopeptide (TPR) repeat protein
MRIGFPLITSTLVCLLIASSTPRLLADDVVAPIRSAYEEGNFNHAEYLALKALQNQRQLSPEDVLEIHKLLAFCYVALDDRQAAINEFLEVLDRNPRLTLEPLYVSPKIIDVFNAAKAQFQSRPRPTETMNPADRIRLQASMRSLLLPGLGQFHKGQPTRGYVFMTAQGITVGAWISLVVITNNKRDDYRSQTNPAEIDASYRDYKTVYRLRNTAGIAAIAVYIASFLDALYGPSPHLPATMSIHQLPTHEPCLTMSIIF